MGKTYQVINEMFERVNELAHALNVGQTLAARLSAVEDKALENALRRCKVATQKSRNTVIDARTRVVLIGLAESRKTIEDAAQRIEQANEQLESSERHYKIARDEIIAAAELLPEVKA